MSTICDGRSDHRETHIHRTDARTIESMPEYGSETPDWIRTDSARASSSMFGDIISPCPSPLSPGRSLTSRDGFSSAGTGLPARAASTPCGNSPVGASRSILESSLFSSSSSCSSSTAPPFLPSIYRWVDVTVNVFGELPVMSVMLINVSHKRMRIMLHFTAGRKNHGRHARAGHPMSFSGSRHLKEAPRGRMEP